MLKVTVIAACLLGVCLAQTPPTPPPASTCAPEPEQLYSVGAGMAGLGPVQPFGYYSVSQRMTCGTYATQINEFARLKGGKVGTCALAGVSKVLWRFGPFAIGLVGDAGVCQTIQDSAGGALGQRSFISAKLGKTNFHLVGTAEGLKVAGSNSTTNITFGVMYGK